MVATKCNQKITVIFKLRELRIFDFCIFFCCYVDRHICYICKQYQPFWIVSLFLKDKKLSRVLMCSSTFCYSKKWKIYVKNTIKCTRTFEMLTVTFGESTMSRTQVQLWYNWFKEGRENINDYARLGGPTPTTY